METLLLKDLYYKPQILGNEAGWSDEVPFGDKTLAVGVSMANPFTSLPDNYFTWPEAQIVARYWTAQCTNGLKAEIAARGSEAWRSFKIQNIIGKEAYKNLLDELKAAKDEYEKLGLWIHGYSTPPQYFAEALGALMATNPELSYAAKPAVNIVIPEKSKPSVAKQRNEPLSNGQDLATIKHCIACGSDQIWITVKQGGILWLGKYQILACAKCGTKLRKKLSGSDSWQLYETGDKNSRVWQGYGQQTLTSREWVNIGNGGMSDQQQRVADIENWLEGLNAGTIKVSFKGIDTPVILKPNEDLLFVLPNVTLKEPRAVRKSTGGYAGPSFRIAKGVYFRMGRFGSTSESHQEIRTIDRGILTVTGERFVFSGGMKTINIDLRKIVQADPFVDGIALHKEGREKTQYFVWNENMAHMQLSRDGRNYSEPINGMIVKCVMEGAIRNFNKPRR